MREERRRTKKIQKEYENYTVVIIQYVFILNLLTQAHTTHHTTSQLNVVVLKWIKLFENEQTTGTTTYAFGCSTIVYLVLVIYFCGAAVAIVFVGCLFLILCVESLWCRWCRDVWSCAFLRDFAWWKKDLGSPTLFSRANFKFPFNHKGPRCSKQCQPFK